MGLADWFRETFPQTPLVELGKGPDGFTHYRATGQAANPIPNYAPRLSLVRTAPSREEWAAWRDDPATLFVMAALKRNAEECEEEWMQASWEGGKADQHLLIALRERSDALNGFTGDYEDFCAVLGIDPEPVEEA